MIIFIGEANMIRTTRCSREKGEMELANESPQGKFSKEQDDRKPKSSSPYLPGGTIRISNKMKTSQRGYL